MASKSAKDLPLIGMRGRVRLPLSESSPVARGAPAVWAGGSYSRKVRQRGGGGLGQGWSSYRTSTSRDGSAVPRATEPKIIKSCHVIPRADGSQSRLVHRHTRHDHPPRLSPARTQGGLAPGQDAESAVPEAAKVTQAGRRRPGGRLPTWR